MQQQQYYDLSMWSITAVTELMLIMMILPSKVHPLYAVYLQQPSEFINQLEV